MKESNKKGFTLIELLAVIIILGILMIIAIPSVTEYITNSRKKAYITTASNYISSVRNKVNSLEYKFTDIGTIYYVPSKCITLEKGGKSPFGDWKEAYVTVTFDGKGYQYYWTSYDSANYGVVLTKESELDSEKVVTGITSINKGLSAGATKISEIGSDCSTISTDEISALYPTKESCFAFTPGTKTITRYYENEGNSSSNPPCPKDVVIPKQIGGVDVENLYDAPSVADAVFYQRDITSVILPNTLKTIGARAFVFNKLTQIVLPPFVTTIGRAAFYQNKLSGTLIIPKSLITIDRDAFGGWTNSGADPITNQLESIVFEPGSQLQTIEWGAFFDNKLSGNITVPQSVVFIGDGAFSGRADGLTNKLSNVTFENNSKLETISDGAFRYNNLTGTITIPKTMKTLGNGAFQGTTPGAGNPLTNQIAMIAFESDSQLQVIGDNAFRDNGTGGSLTIPKTVISIGAYAFGGAHNVTSLTFESPSQLQTIGNVAFGSNTKLVTVTIPSSVTTMGTTVFRGNSLLTTIVNKTGRSFTWCGATGVVESTGCSPTTSFVTGTITITGAYARTININAN